MSGYLLTMKNFHRFLTHGRDGRVLPRPTILLATPADIDPDCVNDTLELGRRAGFSFMPEVSTIPGWLAFRPDPDDWAKAVAANSAAPSDPEGNPK